MLSCMRHLFLSTTNSICLTALPEILKGTIKLSNLDEIKISRVRPLLLEIGNRRNSIFLGLAKTNISGYLLVSISKLKKIQIIAIYRTLLSRQIPEEIGDCAELQNLYMYHNMENLYHSVSFTKSAAEQKRK